MRLDRIIIHKNVQGVSLQEIEVIGKENVPNRRFLHSDHYGLKMKVLFEESANSLTPYHPSEMEITQPELTGYRTIAEITFMRFGLLILLVTLIAVVLGYCWIWTFY